jgi:8-oxo-dGTP pyrophosphatase MutT (NUDIX family)
MDRAGFESRLRRALHPTSRPPPGPGWNLPELLDLLPDGGRALKPAAVLIGLVERATGPGVLLTRRTETLNHHAGQISFPGGRIESGDADTAAAAMREAAEEIGLQSGQCEPLGFLDPFVTITGFHVWPLVARVSPAFRGVPDPREVAEIFEAPLDFLLDPLNESRLDMSYQGRQRSIVEFRWNDYRIWGATAAMLVNLRRRLDEAGP